MYVNIHTQIKKKSDVADHRKTTGAEKNDQLIFFFIIHIKKFYYQIFWQLVAALFIVHSVWINYIELILFTA